MNDQYERILALLEEADNYLRTVDAYDIHDLRCRISTELQRRRCSDCNAPLRDDWTNDRCWQCDMPEPG